MTFDKIEWYDICRKLRPGLMWDDYEVIWQDFLDHMRRRELHSARDQTHFPENPSSLHCLTLMEGSWCTQGPRQRR